MRLARLKRLGSDPRGKAGKASRFKDNGNGATAIGNVTSMVWPVPQVPVASGQWPAISKRLMLQHLARASHWKAFMPPNMHLTFQPRAQSNKL